MIDARTSPGLAVHCRYLKRSLSLQTHEPLMTCTYVAREGRDCVGPFLDAMTTNCGFWEALAPGPPRVRVEGRRGDTLSQGAR